MSGHSKWSQIKRQKGVADAKRGQAFTKIGNAITVAVIHGGGIANPDDNPRLRLIMEKAREMNMPRDNIKRAIDKALGEGGKGSIEEAVYEGYGPSGIAVIVEAASDNKQRTFQEVRSIFERFSGTLAGTGAVSYLFKQMGLITVFKDRSFDEMTLLAADLGAEDVEEANDLFEIYTDVADLHVVKQKLVDMGFKVSGAEVVRKPVNLLSVTDESAAKRILSFIDSLEESDDVQKVFSNFDVPLELLTKIMAS